MFTKELSGLERIEEEMKEELMDLTNEWEKCTDKMLSDIKDSDGAGINMIRIAYVVVIQKMVADARKLIIETK